MYIYIEVKAQQHPNNPRGKQAQTACINLLQITSLQGSDQEVIYAYSRENGTFLSPLILFGMQ